jgi:hypothetical protein
MLRDAQVESFVDGAIGVGELDIECVDRCAERQETSGEERAATAAASVMGRTSCGCFRLYMRIIVARY